MHTKIITKLLTKYQASFLYFMLKEMYENFHFKLIYDLAQVKCSYSALSTEELKIRIRHVLSVNIFRIFEKPFLTKQIKMVEQNFNSHFLWDVFIFKN